MAAGWEQKRKQAMTQLLKTVEAEGGIRVVPMWELRDAAGWDKLGVRVVVDIANVLDQHGMGTLPVGQTLPLDQMASVRVFDKRSRVSSLVEAVTRPSGVGDQVLREAANADAADVLDRIRALVSAD